MIHSLCNFDNLLGPKKPHTVVAVTYLIYFSLENIQLHLHKSISKPREEDLSDLTRISIPMARFACPYWVPGKVPKENNGMKHQLYCR